MSKEDFVKKYISRINAENVSDWFASIQKNAIAEFNSLTDIRSFLSNYFNESLVEDVDFKNQLISELKKRDYVKNRIPEIANEYFIHKADLKNFYDSELPLSLKDDINKDLFIENILNFIKQSHIQDQAKFNYSKNSIKKILEKQYDLVFSNGFSTNLLGINSGVMTANAGDSAQFLFLARAILAGFNCSNVDVRSSRYDAIVDYENTLLRVQVKGVTNNSISFKDRDRGGQGIDHRHERNKGKRITSQDCDIYVAVDKQVGICYIIPMFWVDTLSDDQINSVGLQSEYIQKYKENWNIFADVVSGKSKKYE